jgi:hypothetical protein
MPRATPLHILRARATQLQQEFTRLADAHAASQQLVETLQEPLHSQADDQLDRLEAQLRLFQQGEQRIQQQMADQQRRLDDALRLDAEITLLLAGSTPQV